MEEQLWSELKAFTAAEGRSATLKLLGNLLLKVSELEDASPSGASMPHKVRTSTNIEDSVTSLPSPVSSEGSQGTVSKHDLADPKPKPANRNRKKSEMWERGIKQYAALEDPWAHLRLDLCPAEHAIRHRYNARNKEWSTDDVFVKMSDVKFAQGAMRECFAMKKRAAISSNWARAGNYVAKRYMKAVGREEYFNDVILQMDTKALADEFNKAKPPKPVDVMQCYLIEFHERPGTPLYCVEHLVEGDYVKYNSNNSFVRQNQDGITRSTPQAFSHFTYHHTKGEKMVVDVQGVGDLYTDPQIHSYDGEGYGEGNLGTRGFALFFFTHVCTPLCSQLGLSRFPICAPERQLLCSYCAPEATSPKHSNTMIAQKMIGDSESLSDYGYDSKLLQLEQKVGPEVSTEEILKAIMDIKTIPETPDTDALVHWQVCQLYGEACMTEGNMYGRELSAAMGPAGLYHLRLAAMGGVRAAALALWRLHSGMELTSSRLVSLQEFLSDQQVISEDRNLAAGYLLLAARGGVVSAAASIAQQYASGDRLPTDPTAALEWYQHAYNWQTGAEDEIKKAPADGIEGKDIELNAPETSPPLYEILASMAEIMHTNGQLDKAYEKYEEAAEEAQNAMKGKLAAKYYEKMGIVEGEMS
eukprot:CAMPEP_0197861382 /NCGR_PEP_ID=MMETSP1438-20131217/37418_1 /TAXON_ID=1461541 /ORGANISM="Pterosperma sp., Strain CCMP1384" /LENGTH=641 /DNA_ID=CAMNT_0043478543 /DNA_START=78 /DNA_END=2003 /DNA_ORIENTATION=+